MSHIPQHQTDMINGSFIEITNHSDGKGRIFLMQPLRKSTIASYIKNGQGDILKQYPAYSVCDPMIKGIDFEYVLKENKLVRIFLDGFNNAVIYHPKDKVDLEYRVVYQSICVKDRFNLLKIDGIYSHAKNTIRAFVEFHEIRGADIEETLFEYFMSAMQNIMKPTLYVDSKYDKQGKHYIYFTECDDEVYLHIVPDER